MKTAKEMKDIAATAANTKALQAKHRILMNPSEVWKVLERHIKTEADNGGNYIIVPRPELLAAMADSKVWSQNEVYKTLQDLGYEINPSFSTNPENETWTINWSNRSRLK